MEDRKLVNTYYRLTAMRVMLIFSAWFLWLLTKPMEHFEFSSKLFHVLNLWDMWEALDASMYRAIRILIVGAIISYVLSFLYQAFLNSTTAWLDIAADLLLFGGYVLFYVFRMIITKAHMVPTFELFKKVILLLFVLLALVIHRGTYLENKNSFDIDREKDKYIVFVLFAITVIASLIRFVPTVVKFEHANKYYRKYVNEKHYPRKDIEDQLGNMAYRSISSGSLLFYQDEEYVYKVDGQGEITNLYTKIFKNRRGMMAYDDGYLYYTDADEGSQSIIRINVQTLESEIVVETDHWGYNIAIKDGYLYYVDKADNSKAAVYRLAISKDMKNSKPQLYVVEYTWTSFPIYRFISEFVYDDNEFLFKSNMHGMYDLWFDYSLALTKKGYYYAYMKPDTYEEDSYATEPTSVKPDLARYKSGDEEVELIATKCTSFNIYGDKLFYGVATDEGSELFMADVDDLSNKTLLATTDDGTRVREIVVSDTHVCVEYSVVGCWYNKVISY